MKPGNGAVKANRQCWECLKRRLVCDYTLPHCKKCTKNGKECPGYAEQKPLQWVETGKVTSRRRRKGVKDASSETYNSAAPHVEQEADQDVEYGESSESNVASAGEGTMQDLQKSAQEFFESAYNFDREHVEAIVAKQSKDEARKMLRKSKDPLKGLEKVLEFMTLEDLPCYNLRSETSEVVQAVQYFNMRIYPQAMVGTHLAPNPHIIPLPPAALHLLPPSVHHALVCLSLNHYIYSLPAGVGRQIADSNWAKVLHHRGAAILELSRYIGNEKTRCSDGTITSIVMLLSVEMQQSQQSNLRLHSAALVHTFELRGGMMHLYRTVPKLRPAIIIFNYIAVFANSTGPAADQFIHDQPIDEQLSDVAEMYGEVFPHCLCPPSLYQEIVRINYIRFQACKALSQGEDIAEFFIPASEIIARVEEFSPRDWAQPGQNYDEWLTIGSMFKSSIMIYAIMAFQSQGIIPYSPEMEVSLSTHGDLLLLDLKTASAKPVLRKFLTFPLVVSGVEAVHRSEAVRNWIEQELSDLARVIGANCALKARAVLRRYWQREEPGWENCFSHPLACVL